MRLIEETESWVVLSTLLASSESNVLYTSPMFSISYSPIVTDSYRTTMTVFEGILNIRVEVSSSSTAISELLH